MSNRIQAGPYSENNDVTRKGNEYILQKYLRFMKLRDNDNILDIGVGDGDTLINVLLPKLPEACGKIVGVDFSDEMIDFARQKYQNGRVDFMECDITSEEVSKELCEKFDHVFSFYCFHWIPQHRQPMKNIYKILKPGGDLLIHIICANPIFEVYERIAKVPKWAPYLQNTEAYISPYFHSADPRGQFEQLLEKEGFVNSKCQIEDVTYTFPTFDSYKKFLMAISPFIGKIPQTQVEEYFQELADEIRRNKHNVEIETCDDGEEERVKITYSLLVVYSSKPL